MKFGRVALILFVAAIILIWFFSTRDRDRLPVAHSSNVPAEATPHSENLTSPAHERPVAEPEAEPSPLGNSKLTKEQIEKIRSSAKAGLAASFTAQQAFFAEYHRYTTDLKFVGLRPDSPKLEYKLGFLGSYIPGSNADLAEGEDPRRNSTDSFQGLLSDDPNVTFEYDDEVRDIRLDDYSNYCRNGCTANENGFEMILAVPLGDAKHVDVWSINEKKDVVLVKDGLKE